MFLPGIKSIKMTSVLTKIKNYQDVEFQFNGAGLRTNDHNNNCVLIKKYRRRLLKSRKIVKIPVDLRSVDIREALKIASLFNIYAYDAYFLMCAISLHSPLITLDRRMIEVAQSFGIHIMEVT